MRRTEVNKMVKNIIERQYPTLSSNKKEDILEKVSKTIRKDYYALDLNLKSEIKKRVNKEVYRGTNYSTNNKTI